jgi:hypothetical protein
MLLVIRHHNGGDVFGDLSEDQQRHKRRKTLLQIKFVET